MHATSISFVAQNVPRATSEKKMETSARKLSLGQ